MSTVFILYCPYFYFFRCSYDDDMDVDKEMQMEKRAASPTTVAMLAAENRENGDGQEHLEG